MVESILHKSYVEIIKQWILKSSPEEMIIWCDSDDNIFSKNFPPKIDSYIPDIFALGKQSKRIIIGEAKTSQRDLESEHSEEQLTAYLKHCLKADNSMVVLAVPLCLINCAKSLLYALKRRNSIGSVATSVINPLLLK